MQLFGSDLSVAKKSRVMEELPSRMGIDATFPGNDVEGEVSDSPSIEVNSGVGLQKSDSRVLGYNRGVKGSSNYRPSVWTMRDLYNYSACNGYASGLYNLAWAQAVQNKSLDDVVVMIDPVEKSKRLASVVATVDDKEDESNDVIPSKKEVISMDSDDDTEGNNTVVDDELEEGELEEGEIDMDAELNDNAQGIVRGSSQDIIIIDSSGRDFQMGALKLPHLLISETLDNLTVEEAKKSFQDICSRLLNVLISFNELKSVDKIEKMDARRDQLFSAIRTVEHAFVEMTEDEQEANKCIFSRLITNIVDQISLFFTPKQMQEIEVIRHGLDAFSKGTLRPNCEDELNDVTPEDTSASDMSIEDISGDFSCFETSSSKSTLVAVVDGRNTFSESSEPLVSSIKRKGFPGLLVDLHKAHDADSLPSPTRETPRNSSVLSTSTIDTELFRLDTENTSFMSSKPQKSLLHPYETDALQAVSTYQQKFGRTSLLDDRLPSPTPSYQGDVGDSDIGGDVSSSYSCANGSAPLNNIDIRTSDVTTKMEESTNPWNVLKAKSLPSRDPRLRDTILSQSTSDSNSKSNNATEIASHGEIVVSRSLSDEPPIKRQRNNSENCMWRTIGKNDVEPMRTETRALPQVDLRSENNGMMAADERMVCTEANLVSCLSTLLKDIDPALLTKLLQMGQQQKLSTESMFTQNVPHTPNMTVGSLKFPQESPTKQVELETIRMKPRDPRRVLHSNTLGMTSITSIQDSKRSPNPDNPTNIISTPSTSAPTSEFSFQFMQNLRGTTGLLSPSHHPPQPIMVGGERTGVRADCIEKKNASCLASERTPAHNDWEGVEHLLDGYDDAQKATIHKERARRLDEQRRMFSSHKLSLVLDLDHTLLNSAKFIEVDPVHEEILRKKEEQDRENLERHLYRFVHMGMWTKLRPGIWNFLEKASKLYELHLYTMGNKLYATEMAKILDPNGTLFGGRVLSRGDDGDPFDGEERVPKTKDLDGVLGMESSVLIVDDSVRVWPHNKLNLIVVERYTYFPCSRRQFGLVGPSLLEIGHDERPEDGTLASSLVVIERIHRNFFSHPRLEDMDVRNILATEQQKILGGCRIVFSRVFPIGEANPHLHPLWQTAEQFGATCTNQIDERVTHVVANSLGTDKVNWAISTGRYVVHPGWVEASALLYRRANEFNFSIKS